MALALTETWPNVVTATGTNATVQGDRLWVVDGLTTPDFAVVADGGGTGVNAIGPSTVDTGQKNWMHSSFDLATVDHYFRGTVKLTNEGAGVSHSFRFNVRLTDHGASVYSYYHVQAARWNGGALRNVILIDHNVTTTLYTDSTDPGESFEMGILVRGATIRAWWGATVVTVTDTTITSGTKVGFNTGPDATSTPSFSLAYNMAFGDATYALGRVARRGGRVWR